MGKIRKPAKSVGISAAGPKSDDCLNNITDSDNELYHKQTGFLNNIPDDIKSNFFSTSAISPLERANIWMKQADLGENLVNQYSWATPDTRAIRILKHFSPIVEIGCGSNGYWSKLMHKHGIDIIAFDLEPKEGGLINKERKKRKKLDRIENSTNHALTVHQGGPDVLSSITWKQAMNGRALFLCYPDDRYYESDEKSEDHQEETLGSVCLDHFQGDIVIHVGELFADTLSYDQAPWGRSSGTLFQQRLASEFHCLLKAQLPSWLHVRDTISVWKRSHLCPIVFQGDETDSESGGDEEVQYKFIPKEELLPTDVAAPCIRHLL